MARSEGLLGGLSGVGAPRKKPTDDPRPPPLPLQGNAIESEHLSELTEEEYEAHYIRRQDLKGFVWLDAKYLNPFFTRRLTQEVGRWPAAEAPSPSSLRTRGGQEWGGGGPAGPAPPARPSPQPAQHLLFSFLPFVALV